MNTTIEYESEFNLLDQDYFSNSTNIKVNRFYKKKGEK